MRYFKLVAVILVLFLVLFLGSACPTDRSLKKKIVGKWKREVNVRSLNKHDEVYHFKQDNTFVWTLSQVEREYRRRTQTIGGKYTIEQGVLSFSDYNYIDASSAYLSPTATSSHVSISKSFESRLISFEWGKLLLKWMMDFRAVDEKSGELEGTWVKTERRVFYDFSNDEHNHEIKEEYYTFHPSTEICEILVESTLALEQKIIRFCYLYEPSKKRVTGRYHREYGVEFRKKKMLWTSQGKPIKYARIRK